MTKYRLSNSVVIVNTIDYGVEATPFQYQSGYYIISDNVRNKEFLINETVKYFIDKFSLPRTMSDVLKEIALDVKGDIKAIKSICSHFLQFLCRRHIVVPENSVEQIELDEPIFKTGDSIDGLTILDIISRKKHLDIYLVIDDRTNSTYVIKCLNKNKIGNEEKYADELYDLKYEFNMLQKIKHISSVCQVYELNENKNENAYILMEHVKGKSLSRFLKQTEGLTEFHCYSIIRNILNAFSLLHQNKLVHGDIHPSNIMVNEDLSIKIIDLGLSIDVSVESNEVLRIGGVIYYMPPERINISSKNKFSKEASHFSDVYQLGLILYYVLYREEPFKGFIWEELSSNIKKSKADYPCLSFLGLPVNVELIKIIEKCLNKRPQKRYATATEILEDFEKVPFYQECLLY